MTHPTAVSGHTHVGLSTSLSGNEDVLITREAAVVWKGLSMSWHRAEAIEEVRESVACDELSWGSVRPLGVDTSTMGERVEGVEL